MTAELPKPVMPAVRNDISLEWGYKGDVRLHIETIDPALGTAVATTTLHFKDASYAEKMAEYVLSLIRRGRPPQSTALPQ